MLLSETKIKELMSRATAQDVERACESGNYELVKLLLEHNAPIDEYAIANASGNGHLEIVRLLLEHKAPIDKWAIAYARHNGHIEVVELLEQHMKRGVKTSDVI